MLTRGGDRLATRRGAPRGRSSTGSREPPFPSDLRAFVRWVDAMNADMRERGDSLRPSCELTSSTRTTGSWPAPPSRSRARPGCHGWSPSTRPSTAATRAGSRSTPSPTSTPPSATMVRTRRPRDHLLAVHAQPRGRACSGVAPARITAIQNGIDPARPRTGRRRPRRRCARATPSPTSGWCCWSAVSSTRRASTSRSTRSRPVIASSAASASSSPARAPPRPSSTPGVAAGPAPPRDVPRLGRRRHAPLAVPGRRPRASSRRSTSRSGSSRSRRWRPGACAWSPTPAGCARWCPATARSASGSRRATRPRSQAILERVLTDDAARAPARRRGARARAALRLGRGRAADAGGLRLARPARR